MNYEGTVYRPPSEAYSLIIQVTIGCAHNSCTFCSMYKDKKFRVRSQKEIFRDLDEAALHYRQYKLRIFLADGDATVLPTEDLLAILKKIHENFPFVERITAYSTARDILNKPLEELIALRKAGLAMVYLGAESGDDQVLKAIVKGVTSQEMIEAGKLLKKAGIALSMTLISGLWQLSSMEEHAIKSANLVSAMNPDYLGFLTLRIAKIAPMHKQLERGEIHLPGPEEIQQEMRLFLQHVDSEGTVFRANHASNYIVLKGTLNRDIPQMLYTLDHPTIRKYVETL